MAFPHGGAASVFRDADGPTPHDPIKDEIRTLGTDYEARIETTESAAALNSAALATKPVVGFSGNRVVADTEGGRLFVASAAGSLVLPDSSVVGDFIFAVYARGGDVTLTPSGSDTVELPVVKTGGSMTIFRDGTTWYSLGQQGVISGTWTPTLTNSASESPTSETVAGQFTRTSNRLWLDFTIDAINVAGMNAALPLFVGGIPVPSRAAPHLTNGSVSTFNVTIAQWPGCFIGPSSQGIILSDGGHAASDNLLPTQVGSSASINGSISYLTDAP